MNNSRSIARIFSDLPCISCLLSSSIRISILARFFGISKIEADSRNDVREVSQSGEISSITLTNQLEEQERQTIRESKVLGNER